MGKNYYMVRAMSSRERDFDVFLKNKVVAVGWSEVDFTKYSSDDAVKEVEKIYYSAGDIVPQVVGRKLNQVHRFKEIKAGDYIIIPYYNAILLAIAEDECLYDTTAEELDLANQRKVKYQYIGNNIKTIPRDNLTEALQRRLRVRGSTVSNLYEFKDEIEEMFSQQSYSAIMQIQQKEKEKIKMFKDKLLKNIQQGSTVLKTGGIGLENLVAELFQCEGYDAKVLPKTKFAGIGDADVQAEKSDMFMEKKILAQVKHHDGYSDEYGISQLESIIKSDDFNDYSCIFITSGYVNDQVRNKAENLNINVIDGVELVDWIFEHIDDLSEQQKSILKISTIPQIID